MVTQAKGLWGAPVTAKGYVAGDNVLQTVLAGSATAGSMAVTPTITGAACHCFDIVAVANRVGNTTAIVVPPGSPIKSVADLKGKSLAIQDGTTTALDIVSYILPKYGLSSKDVKLVNMNMGDMPAALAAHRVDAIASVEPFISQAVLAHVGVRLQSLAPYDPIPVFIVFRRTFVQQHPAEVVKALHGYFTAVKWIHAHPTETVGLIQSGLAQQGVQLSQPVVAMAWKTVDLNVNFSTTSMIAYLNKVANLLLKEGAIKSIPNFSQYVRLDLAQKAMSQG